MRYLYLISLHEPFTGLPHFRLSGWRVKLFRSHLIEVETPEIGVRDALV